MSDTENSSTVDSGAIDAGTSEAITPEKIVPCADSSVARISIAAESSDAISATTASIAVSAEDKKLELAEQDAIAKTIAEKEKQSKLEEEERAKAIDAKKTGGMELGEVRYGVTCTGEPIGGKHWLVDSSTCGDLVAALPTTVLIASRRKNGGGKAVNMLLLLDAVIDGAAAFDALDGIALKAGLPVWVISRLFGVFPILQNIYSEAIDQAVYTVETAAMKAAAGKLTITRKRKMERKHDGPEGHSEDSTIETFESQLPPDASLGKFILTNRMKRRYKDDGGQKQAVVINIANAEENL